MPAPGSSLLSDALDQLGRRAQTLSPGLVPLTAVAAMRAAGFPVAARGAVPRDIHGRLEVIDHRLPIEIDGVVVRPGDFVVADDDGVVVIPAELRDKAVAAATEKASTETSLREDVRAGMAPSEAFARHRVL